MTKDIEKFRIIVESIYIEHLLLHRFNTIEEVFNRLKDFNYICSLSKKIQTNIINEVFKNEY